MNGSGNCRINWTELIEELIGQAQFRKPNLADRTLPGDRIPEIFRF